MIRAVADDLITTFYPSECMICGDSLLRAGLAPVCNACIEKTQPQPMVLCERCGEALDMEGARFASQLRPEGLLCAPCRMAPPAFEQAVSCAVYREELRAMVHLLKYERMRPLAKPLGRLLARAIESLEANLEAETEAGSGKELLVIAVPLFSAKQRERGYNQAVLIADAALDELRRTRPQWRLKAAHSLLRRIKPTRSQFELTPKGRRRNLQGAFAAPDPSKLDGREVLLVDDIYTTGATARACAQALRTAGASKVWVATATRAQPEMVATWRAESNTAIWDAG